MGNLNIKNRYDELFTPFSIGNMEVRNRIVMSPMGTYGANMDGSASEGLAKYFEERAKGGVGAIITASQYLSQKIAQGQLGIHEKAVTSYIFIHLAISFRLKYLYYTLFYAAMQSFACLGKCPDRRFYILLLKTR